MEPELVRPESPLLAGAVAMGSVFAILVTLLISPIIDRYVRPRFRLERGAALLLLLSVSLAAGIASGVASYFWLLEREGTQMQDPPGALEIIRESE
jgi:predicted PurR-regulated permease PerM